MNVDMSGLKKLQVAAAGAFVAWQSATKYAFQNHAGYGATLTTARAAKDAYQAVFDAANSIINQLASDPATDPSWFDASVQSGPVWLRNNAQATLTSIALTQKDVLRDLATHFKLAAQQLSPEAAAAAADAAAKAGTAGPYKANPNALDPSKQSNQHPPADAPAGEGMGTASKAGLFAALGIALYWIAGKVLR